MKKEVEGYVVFSGGEPVAWFDTEEKAELYAGNVKRGVPDRDRDEIEVDEGVCCHIV